MHTEEHQKSSVMHKVFTVVGAIMCVVLIPMLAVNLTLIVKSFINPNEVPDVGGYFPMIVLTDSMADESQAMNIEAGDLIIVESAKPEDVKLGDVITFYDPEGNGTTTVTHAVIEIINDADGLKWKTKGYANNTEDRSLVPADKLLGIYKGTRIPNAGNVAMFMQTTPGLIVCVICPLILLVGYDVIRRKFADKNRKDDTDALMKELQELKALAAANAANGGTPPAPPVENVTPQPTEETAEVAEETAEVAEETAEETDKAEA